MTNVCKNKDLSVQQKLDESLEQLTQQVINELVNKEPLTDDYGTFAYQDSWYPGLVENRSTKSFNLQYMAASQKVRIYFWPDRDDTQNINRIFSEIDLVPECLSSGRL